ncbi:MAG: hypothetical protein ACP5O2_07525 [Bacteroidales bacterium]
MPGRKVDMGGRMALWMGFSSLFIQALWIRMAFTLFEGNELLTGLFLALWMLLVAAGARVRPGHPTCLKLLLLSAVLSLMPVVAEEIVPAWWQHFFLPGSMPSLWQAALFMAAWLSPFCLLMGIGFRWLTLQEVPAKIYAFEAWGGLVGGSLALLIPLLQPSAAWMPWLPAALWPLLLPGNWHSRPLRLTYALVWIALTTLLFLLVIPEKPNTFETPHGQLREVVYAEDTTYRLEGHLLPSINYHPEEAAPLHFALMQAPVAPAIVLIGPLNLSLLHDALKYQPSRLVWLDTAPYATRLILSRTRKKIPPKIETYPYSHPRLEHLDFRPDAIVVMNPEPSSLAAAWWLTSEFAARAQKILHPGGLLSLNLPQVANYFAGKLLSVPASAREGLSQHFHYTRLITAVGTQILASDAPLDFSLEKGLEKTANFSDYVNPWFFRADEIERRSLALSMALPSPTPPSTINQPLVVSYYTGYWFLLNQSQPVLILAFLGLLLWLILRRSPHTGFVMFGVSLTSSALQLLMIFLFQMHTGKLYLTAGLFFALFMGGLAAGAQRKPPFSFRPSQVLWVLLVLSGLSLSPWLFSYFIFGSSSNIVAGLWTAFSIGVGAWMTGQLYSIYAGAYPQRAGSLYAADLAGGATGSLFVALVGVPLAGIFNTTLVLMLILLVMLLFLPLRGAPHKIPE